MSGLGTIGNGFLKLLFMGFVFIYGKTLEEQNALIVAEFLGFLETNNIWAVGRVWLIAPVLKTGGG